MTVYQILRTLIIHLIVTDHVKYNKNKGGNKF